MAAQPRLSPPDLESLLEPLKKAAAHLNAMVAEGQSTLERTNLFINEVQTHLDQRKSMREQDHHNDKNMTLPQHRLAEYEDILRLAGLGLADQDKGLHPAPKHQRDNLDPPVFSLNTHPHHSRPLLYGAMNEQPILNGRACRLNRGSTPYDAAVEQMVSSQRKHRANRNALPNGTPYDKVISGHERRGHAHKHKVGHDPTPLILDDILGHFDILHKPQGPHPRQGLFRGLDTGYYDVKSHGPQSTLGLQARARLDNIHDNDLGIPPRPHPRDPERPNVRTPQHHITDSPFADGIKHHPKKNPLYESQARQTLDPRSTGHLAPLNFPGLLEPPTAAEISHWSSRVPAHDESDARLEQMRAYLRQQDQQVTTRYGKLKPKAPNPTPLRPLPTLFTEDLKQHPHRQYIILSRPYNKDTMRIYTAREAGLDSPTLPIQLPQVSDLNRPHIAAAISTALPTAAPEDTFHAQQHAQGPIVDASRSNTAHNNTGVGAITDPSNNAENPLIPSHACSDSSESGYDTPDFDESSGAGDEDKDEGEGLGWVGM